MMRQVRARFGRILGGFALVILVGAPALAASLALAQAAPEAALDVARVDIKASRVVGFAPLALEVKATLRDADGRELRPVPGQSAVLQVESSYYTIQNGSREQQLYSGGQTGMDAVGRPREEMLRRTLVINRPGTYTLRWVVRDADGGEVLSRDVKIRVM
jgi:hypothetical protein